jgi:hypothetical protein
MTRGVPRAEPVGASEIRSGTRVRARVRKTGIAVSLTLVRGVACWRFDACVKTGSAEDA